MKKYIILFLSLLGFSVSGQNPVITRYESVGKQLFICINSSVTPNKIEHFFTAKEKADSVAILNTIAALEAQLSIIDSLYIPPVVIVNKLKKAKKFIIDPDVIKKQRKKILLKMSRENIIIPDTVIMWSRDTTNIYIP